MTGIEIIRTAKEQSGGRWIPSPGLVYPLLGRLLAEGLIEETEDGGYLLTEKGAKELEHIEQIKQGLSQQYDIFMNIGAAGMFLVKDAVDRLIAFTSMTREEIDSLGEKQRVRYKEFLKNELRRLETAEAGREEPEKRAEETP